MNLTNSIRRLATYYGRHGFQTTIRRAGVAASRALFANGQVVFSCDLAKCAPALSAIPATMQVERLRQYSDLTPPDLDRIVSFWNPRLAHRNLVERFNHGASLWLIRSQGQLAGFGWTLQGRTLEPHYFRLRKQDVHLFDFLVFPQFRGQGINPHLVHAILQNLAIDCHGRAFIEAAEWNHPQLSSLSRTPFRRLGSAKKITVFGHTMVRWKHRVEAERVQKNQVEDPSIDAPAGV